jgi:hypothetical protein
MQAMADTVDITNVTALHPKAERQTRSKPDRTNSERQKRFREKRRGQLPAVTPEGTVTSPVIEKEPDGHNAVTVATPMAASRDGVTVSTFAAALFLATVSGGFSIFGMTAVFAGAFWPVIGMGIALEGGKLSAVAWLGRHARTAPRRLKAGLVALVGVLMMLNAIGAYGFLAKAHIGHALAGDLAVAGRAAEIESRMSVQSGVVTDLDRRIAQIDGTVAAATQRGKINTALAAMEGQRQARRSLTDERDRAAATLATLQVEKASIDGERRMVEADLGPVRYLATLLGAGDQDVMRWFIFVVALLLDPAAVLLLLASARREC